MLAARPAPGCVSPASGGDRRLLSRRERVITERASRARAILSRSAPHFHGGPPAHLHVRHGNDSSYQNRARRALNADPLPPRQGVCGGLSLKGRGASQAASAWLSCSSNVQTPV